MASSNWSLLVALSLPLAACSGSRTPDKSPGDGSAGHGGTGGEGSSDPRELAPTNERELAEQVSRDGAKYRLSWVDDFESELGPSTLGNWTFDSNLAWFHPDNVQLKDGSLQFALTERGDVVIDSDREILGGEYDRIGAQKFGRFLARMKPQAKPGMIASFFTAFYRFNSDYSKLLETAEIDIEFVGDTKSVQFALHWVDDAGVKKQTEKLVPLDFDASADFHTWEIEWLAERVVFYVDGRELHRFTDAAILDQLAIPQEVRANLWVSDSVPWAGAFDAKSLPAHAEYAWVAAYALER